MPICALGSYYIEVSPRVVWGTIGIQLHQDHDIASYNAYEELLLLVKSYSVISGMYSISKIIYILPTYFVFHSQFLFVIIQISASWTY